MLLEGTQCGPAKEMPTPTLCLAIACFCHHLPRSPVPADGGVRHGEPAQSVLHSCLLPAAQLEDARGTLELNKASWGQNDAEGTLPA